MDALRYVLDFRWAASVPPAGVKALFLLFTLAVLLVAVRQPRERVFEGAPDEKPWRDLRYWGAAVMLLQATIYLLG